MSHRYAFIFSLLAAGCSASPRAFKLAFTATSKGSAVTCTDTLSGFGPDGAHTLGMNDLRFYVSNVRFFDAAGKQLAATFEANEFQYADGENVVALIDLTNNTEGSCAQSASGEGTARVHTSLTGTTVVDNATKVTFDIGIPQPVVKTVIGNNTLEGAPSPFAEMYWSWASGYRYFVFNFAVKDASGTSGEGYAHVGSRDCGPMGGKALSDREACTYVNMPSVSLDGIDLDKQGVAVQLDTLLSGIDFRAPVYDPSTFDVVGVGVGVECHSGPTQPDCANIFSALGLSMVDGTADVSLDKVFTVK